LPEAFAHQSIQIQVPAAPAATTKTKLNIYSQNCMSICSSTEHSERFQQLQNQTNTFNCMGILILKQAFRDFASTFHSHATKLIKPPNTLHSSFHTAKGTEGVKSIVRLSSVDAWFLFLLGVHLHLQIQE